MRRSLRHFLVLLLAMTVILSALTPLSLAASLRNGSRGDDVIALLSERLNRVAYRGGAGSSGESGASALKRGYPALKDVLSGVCEPAVDVARVP